MFQEGCYQELYFYSQLDSFHIFVSEIFHYLYIKMLLIHHKINVRSHESNRSLHL